MSKHTPGPWHVANGVQIRSQRDQIAKVWMMRGGEGKANAALMAAAPDLLAALNLLHEAYCAEDYGTSEGRKAGRQALIATRKALARCTPQPPAPTAPLTDDQLDDNAALAAAPKESNDE